VSSSVQALGSPARKKSARGHAKTVSTPFISGRLADNFWIILAPVVALLVMEGVWRLSGLSDLAIFSVLFALIVTGHHMPGWIRAFGEPAVYSRHKARLWVSLFAIPALVILPTAYGLGTVALTVAAAFDLWHVSMQQHGFGRIYAAKAGDTGRRSARLDLVCVLVWYATVVAWSDAWMEAIARSLRKAGVPLFQLLSAGAWETVKYAMLAASAALAVLYVVNAWKLKRDRGVFAPNKHLLHLVAFAVLIYSYQFASWYRAQSVQNLFHATQYFFMVWIYGSLSIRRDATTPGSVYRALFGRRSGLFLFLLLIALYGTGAYLLSSSGYRLVGADAERGAQIIGSIGLASLLLHFYVDSFIWKVRSKEVRTALAIQEDAAAGDAPAPAVRRPQVRGALHALTYFGIPIAVIAMAGARGRQAPPEAERAATAHEARLFPRSAFARYNQGRAALSAGDAETARRELAAAVELAPSFAGPARLLAELDAREARRAEEIAHAQAAVRAEPSDAQLRYALGNALAREKRTPEAEAQYREVIRLRPDFAGAYQNLGVLRKWEGRLAEAIPLFRKAHALDPDLSAAACDLAGGLATLGETAEAVAILRRYLERHPEDAVAADLDRAIRAAASR
jgi:tetratricopeptide (TPR) repeat protein